MTNDQQKKLIKLTAVFEQFGVVFVEATVGAAYFHASKNAPLEKRHIEAMASALKKQTGLNFMLKPV